MIEEPQISIIKKPQAWNRWVTIFVIYMAWGVDKDRGQWSPVELTAHFVNGELIPLIL